MIDLVLDEHLQDPDLVARLRRWTRHVRNIKDLRGGGTADPEIPDLLRRQRGCVFVTINASHFWGRLAGDPRFAVVCISLPSERTGEIPEMLRKLVRLPPFGTRNGRCGKIFRLTSRTYEYYSRDVRESQPKPWPRSRP